MAVTAFERPVPKASSPPRQTQPTPEEIRKKELARINEANGEAPEVVYTRNGQWGNDLTREAHEYALRNGMYIDGKTYPHSPDAWKQRFAMSEANLLDWRPPAARPGHENESNGGWSPEVLNAVPPTQADPQWLQRERLRTLEAIKQLKSKLGYIEPRALYVRDANWWDGLGDAQGYATLNNAKADGQAYPVTKDIRQQQQPFTADQVDAWQQLPLARARLAALEGQLEKSKAAARPADSGTADGPSVYQRAQSVADLVKAEDKATRFGYGSRGEADAARSRLRQAGVTEQEIDNRRQDYRAFDFSRGHQAARLSTGEIIVNPELALDPDKWRAALNEVHARPEEINRAMDARLEMREDLAQVLEGLAFQSGAYQNFLKKLSTEQNRSGEFGSFDFTTPGMRLEEFYRRTGKGFGNLGTLLYQSIRGSNARMGQGIYGALDALTGGEISTLRDLADTARETAENAEGITRAVRGGLWARVLAKSAAIAHGVLSEVGLGAAAPFVGMGIEAGRKHNQMLSENKSREEANSEALRSLARDGVTEWIAKKTKLDSLIKTGRKTGLRELGRHALNGAIGEGGRSGIEQGFDQLTDPNARPFSVREMAERAAQGAARNALQHAGDAFPARRDQRPQPPGQQPPGGGGNPPPTRGGADSSSSGGSRNSQLPGARPPVGSGEGPQRQAPPPSRNDSRSGLPPNRQPPGEAAQPPAPSNAPKHDSAEFGNSSSRSAVTGPAAAKPLPKASPEVNEAFVKLPETHQRIFLGLIDGKKLADLATESGLTPDQAAAVMESTTAQLREAGLNSFSARLERPATPSAQTSNVPESSAEHFESAEAPKPSRHELPLPTYEEIAAHPAYETLKPKEKFLFARLQQGVPPREVQRELGLNDEGFRFIRHITAKKLERGGAFDQRADGTPSTAGGNRVKNPEPALVGGGHGGSHPEPLPEHDLVPAGGGAPQRDEVELEAEPTEHDVFASSYAPMASKVRPQPAPVRPSLAKPPKQSRAVVEPGLAKLNSELGLGGKGPKNPPGGGDQGNGDAGGPSENSPDDDAKKPNQKKEPDKKQEPSDEAIFDYIQQYGLEIACVQFAKDGEDLMRAYMRVIRRNTKLAQPARNGPTSPTSKFYSKRPTLKKPSYSPDIKKWVEGGGKIKWLDDGTWVYIDWDKPPHRVKYIGGFPDFKEAGMLLGKSVEIPHFTDDYDYDFDRGDDALMRFGKVRHRDATWHHHQDLHTLQQVDKELHARFTHTGGVSETRRINRDHKKQQNRF